MKYLECKIELRREDLETALALLSCEGIDGVVVNDPLDVEDLLNKKNSWDWDYVDPSVLDLAKETPSVTFYLPDDDENGKAVFRALERKFGASEGISARLSCKTVSDEDWKDRWKEYFKPAKVGETIVVQPSWEKYEAAPGEKVIVIDPGQAFGTGTHETTSLCMRMLEKYGAAGKKVLDVGCGSGILAIAAGLLGASDVLGIEIDREAIPVAEENIAANGLSNLARVRYGDLTKGVDYRADVIVANLMADLVKMLSKDAKAHLLPGGIYISSGILVEKEDEVREAIELAGFEIAEIAEDGEWCAIVAREK